MKMCGKDSETKMSFKTPSKTVNLRMGKAKAAIETSKNKTVSETPRKNISEKPRKMKAPKKFSNDPLLSVKVFCSVCDTVYAMSGLRKHIAHKHKLTLTQYRIQFGEPRKQIIHLVHHSCNICKKTVLFDTDDISKHVTKFHKMSYTTYAKQYMEKGSGFSKSSSSPKTPSASKSSSPVPPTPTQSKNLKKKMSKAASTPSPKTSMKSSSPVLPPTPPATPPVNIKREPVEENVPSQTHMDNIGTPSPSSSTSLVLIQCDVCFKIFSKNIQLKVHKKKNHS